MERSGQEPKQEAKPAVGGIDQRNTADQEYVSNPGSPSGWESPLRGRKDAPAAAAAAEPLPPPRTPEKREISAAMSPERPSAVLDRRASAATNSGGTIVYVLFLVVFSFCSPYVHFFFLAPADGILQVLDE